MTRRFYPIPAAFFVAMLTACNGGGGGTLPTLAQPDSGGTAPDRSRTPSKYVYVADRSSEKLLVYPAYVDNPQPIRTLGKAQGIVQIGGIAVDRAGDVYVANGNGRDVLEFAPGATSFIQKYKEALNHPVSVATDGKTLYVADQEDHYPYGINSSVVEYPNGATAEGSIVLDPDLTTHPIHGVALDSRGRVWISTSQSGDVWPPPRANCQQPPVDTLFAFFSPTLIMTVPLAQNIQVWGLAIDRGVIYGSDYCTTLQTYAYRGWRKLGPAPGSGEHPMYATTSADHLLVIPLAGTPAGSNGYVTVEPESGGPAYTIKAGLRGPIGAAAGP